eukprot:3329203-Alexandrium_andersonii.AAC.1
MPVAPRCVSSQRPVAARATTAATCGSMPRMATSALARVRASARASAGPRLLPCQVQGWP